MTTYLDWRGCYRGSWKNEIVPDAFQHPAKYARRLIARIYDHLLDERLIERGARVIDPFGGVALGALDAMRCGVDWTGVELEPKFHALGNANIALWNTRYSSLPRWGTARLLNGDSRNLAQIVRGAECAVSSPPYSETILHADQRRAADSSYKLTGTRLERGGQYNVENPRNLGNLREGDFAAAISSPPYEEARIGESSGAAHVGHGENYGSTAGQLGSMAGGDFSAAVSSPPYEGASISQTHMTSNKRGDPTNPNFRPSWKTKIDAGYDKTIRPYGESVGQIGETSGETFWLASRQIVSQVHSVFAPRGIVVWVVKDFVRNKERVPFCAQWRELCEVIGFEHLYTARAWLVEDNGTQLAHDGNHKRHVKERKSFFRRLNEKNGGPRIDWEEVIFMVKP